MNPTIEVTVDEQVVSGDKLYAAHACKSSPC